MLFNLLAARKITHALRVGALAGLLALVAGCNNGAATVPTAAVTPPITVPTQGSTVPDPTPEPKATNTIEIAPSATTEAPTVPPTEITAPIPEASNTPAPTVAVGDLEWKQVGLAGNNVTSLSFLSQGTNLAVLAAGPKGVWTGTYDYTQWEKRDVKMAEEARNGEADVASAEVMYVTSHTWCASGLPSARSRSTDGGKTWQDMTDDAMTIAASNATTAYSAKCSGISKTTDSGETWTDLPVTSHTSDPMSLATSPDGQMVYAAYLSEGGTGQIMMSTDGGNTWSDVTPRNVPGDGFVAPGHLTFVTGSEGKPDDGGLYLTNDKGVWFLPLESSEWKFMEKPQLSGEPEGNSSNYTAFFVDTAYSIEYDKPGPILYTARARSTETHLEGQGVYRSSDLGATWQSVGKGIETHVVNSLALIPYDASSGRVETLLAATEDGIWALTMPPTR